MASQVVPAAKRFRMSLLLDAYGVLLTEKQRSFLRQYFEEDLSFGEIAREHNVSRQAIYDSVKHGEEALERYEEALRLVERGWSRLVESGLMPEALAKRLALMRTRLAKLAGSSEVDGVLRDLDAVIGLLSYSEEEGVAADEAGE